VGHCASTLGSHRTALPRSFLAGYAPPLPCERACGPPFPASVARLPSRSLPASKGKEFGVLPHRSWLGHPCPNSSRPRSGHRTLVVFGDGVLLSSSLVARFSPLAARSRVLPWPSRCWPPRAAGPPTAVLATDAGRNLSCGYICLHCHLPTDNCQLPAPASFPVLRSDAVQAPRPSFAPIVHDRRSATFWSKEDPWWSVLILVLTALTSSAHAPHVAPRLVALLRWSHRQSRRPAILSTLHLFTLCAPAFVTNVIERTK
jgi:hypothetical protein